MKKAQISTTALEGLVSIYPAYSWRIWTRRYCAEIDLEVLSASSFFLDMPDEALFLVPAVSDVDTDDLLNELNARAGWDQAIQQWQNSRLLALLNNLPASVLGAEGHG